MHLCHPCYPHAPPSLLLSFPPAHSFGVILWELVTGKTPFVRKHASGPELTWRDGFPKLPAACKHICPPRLANLIHTCLREDPLTRPPWNLVLANLARLQQTACGEHTEGLAPPSPHAHASAPVHAEHPSMPPHPAQHPAMAAAS